MNNYLQSYLDGFNLLLTTSLYLVTFGKIDFRPVKIYHQKKTYVEQAEEDAQALASDWQKVGDDLRWAIRQYDKDQTNNKE